MIKTSHLLITGLSALVTRIGQEKTAHATVLQETALGAQKSYLDITFAGTTRTYVDLGLCQFSQQDTIEFWYLKAGPGHGNFLSIAVCDQWTGSFAFGRSQPEQKRVSVVTYGIAQSIFSSHYTLADEHSEYLLTEGVVHVKHNENQKFIKGAFLGTLMPLHTAHGPASLLPISGHFCLTR